LQAARIISEAPFDTNLLLPPGSSKTMLIRFLAELKGNFIDAG
jgi:hypothetical protein